MENNRSGKHIKLFTGDTKKPFCNIYHEKLKQNISVNGRHEAISVMINNGEFIFDNVHPQGVFPAAEWIYNFHFPGQDIGLSFQITEESF